MTLSPDLWTTWVKPHDCHSVVPTGCEDGSPRYRRRSADLDRYDETGREVEPIDRHRHLVAVQRPPRMHASPRNVGMLLSGKIRYFAMISRPAEDEQHEHDHRDPLRRDHRFLVGLGRVARGRRNGGRGRARGSPIGRLRSLWGNPSAARLSLRWCHRSSSIRDRERIEERCDKPGRHTVARGPCARDRQLRQLRLQPRPIRR